MLYLIYTDSASNREIPYIYLFFRLFSIYRHNENFSKELPSDWTGLFLWKKFSAPLFPPVISRNFCFGHYKSTLLQVIRLRKQISWSEIRIQFYPFRDQKSTLIRFLSLCSSLEWCETLCFLSSCTAVLTDLYVSGGVTDTMAGNKALCFTKRPIVLYPKSGVSITASATEITLPIRVIENIEDGVYGFQMDECYCTSEFHPYILIELSESLNISQIALRTQAEANIR